MPPAPSSCSLRRSAARSSMPATAATRPDPGLARCPHDPSSQGTHRGLIVAICGDVLHSRVARSNIHLLNTLGARVRVVAPSTLLATGIASLGVEVYRTMREGLKDADIVMMLRLQLERMTSNLVPCQREYFRFFGLDDEKRSNAKPDALIMHPGPMNRGMEIDSTWPMAPEASSASRSRWAWRSAWRCLRRWHATSEPARAMHISTVSRPSNRAYLCAPHRPLHRPRRVGRHGDGRWQDLRSMPAVTADAWRRRNSSTVPATFWLPGLIDMRVFSGEPGPEYRETLSTEPGGFSRRRHDDHLHAKHRSSHRRRCPGRLHPPSCERHGAIKVPPMAAMTKGLKANR